MVHTPYTAYFLDAFLAAHVGIGIGLLALAWAWITAPFARVAFFASITCAILSPSVADFLRGFGGKDPHVTETALLASTALAVVGVVALRRVALTLVALVGGYALWRLPELVTDSTFELCALQLVFVAVLLGGVRRRARAPGWPARHVLRSPDVALFVGATLVAVVVSTFVLEHADGSADEWAYTWQAAAFARLHAYGSVPPCDRAFQNFYVFESMGRLFAQYTPGWPFFMTPFVILGLPWLAGPAAHGLLAVGVARVTRRLLVLDGRSTAWALQAGGIGAAVVATLGTTTLLVGASRYAHTFVAALLAWGLEALLRLGTDARDRVSSGVMLGSAVALMGATRPADGATLACGLAVLFLYYLARGRVGWRPFLATCAGFAAWGGLALVVLRLQLGEWFRTGYSLEALIHPWNVIKYGWPHPSEWKFALPLATGSYAWFPASLALGFAGLASLRGRASGVLVALAVSFLCFDTYYQYVDLGRGSDWGYGPRYETPFLVPMSIGTGLVLATLAARAHQLGAPALSTAGPLVVVMALAAVTLVRLWPMLYPGVYAHVHQHDSLNRRIRELGVHHAVVLTQVGATGFDPLDLTENLPLDLYPDQDVLIAIERKPEYAQCLRQHFPTRRLFRAWGNPVSVAPY